MRGNFKFLFGIAIIAAIGFSVTACSTDSVTPTITGVTISPAYEDGVSVGRGRSRAFTAVVEGTDNPSQDVVWEIVEETAVATYTRISERGILTVDIDEDRPQFTVRAISAFNSSMYAMVTVIVPDLPTLTGTVLVEGIAQVGHTLRADVSGVEYTGALTFQWNSGHTPIPHATSDIYLVQQSDMGYAITVTVWCSDHTSSVTSEPTVLVTYPVRYTRRVPGDTLAEQLEWLWFSATSGNQYLVYVENDVEISSADAELPSGRGFFTVIIRGGGGNQTMRVVTLSENGTLFTVGDGVTLVLDNNVTLQGRDDNDNHLVRVNAGGSLVMNAGSRIIGNTNASSIPANLGGGVRVNAGGTFTMYGGVIAENSVTDPLNAGGGVSVAGGGRFNMRGGTISSNSAVGSGGGIFVALNGVLNISNGIIYGSNAVAALGNTANNGAPLFNAGTAQLGRYYLGQFIPSGYFTDGRLSITINVIDGVLQQRAGSLAEQLDWLRIAALDNGTYTIELSDDETVSPLMLSVAPRNVTIAINGGNAKRVVSLSENGSLFTVGGGVTLVQGNNVTLQGRDANDSPLVQVTGGGAFVMNAGSIVEGNATSANGGGVNVAFGGRFTLNGGEVSGNTSGTNGGGVFVASGGQFYLRAGMVAGNTAIVGGGVFNAGTLNIGGGTILGGNVPMANVAADGAAVLFSSVDVRFGTFVNDSFVQSGTLPRPAATSIAIDATITVANGTIQGMEGSLADQLAWLRYFALSGGEYAIDITGVQDISPDQARLPAGRNDLAIAIGGNGTVNLSGNGSLFTVGSGVTLILDDNVVFVGRSVGGNGNANNDRPLVVVASGGTLIMNAGYITGNTSTGVGLAGPNVGGGVRVNAGGTFVMGGGTISNNRSVGNGGGVHVVWGGTFNMRGGTIANNVSDVGGGGVYNAGTFLMSGGTILGSNAEANGNTAPANDALITSGVAQVGMFNAAGEMYWFGGVLRSTALTVQVQDGVLQGLTGTLAAQLDWLRSFAQDGGEYVVGITGDETIAPQQVLFGSNFTITIVLDGGAEMRTVSLSGSGTLFAIGNGVTLVIGDNVTLKGRSVGGNGNANNDRPLVVVGAGGTLIMNAGYIIANTNASTAPANFGGGVRVDNGGMFTMEGGTVSGNASNVNGGGGGVFVATFGTFNLNDGTITNNSSVGNGGGVRVAWDGTFNMRGGTVLDNSSTVGGGGVFNDGIFRMSGGIILGSNAAPSNGALVNNGIANIGTFNVFGGFAYAGVLRSTALTVHVQNGVLQGLAGTLAAQLDWLRSFAQSGSEYVLSITGNEIVAPQQTFTGTNLTIALDGGTEMRTISLSGNGALFTVGNGVTLVIGDNVTLEGRSVGGNGNVNNDSPLVIVGFGGTLAMNAGYIVGNTNASTAFANLGGGVRVDNGGTFTMEGGTVSGNASNATGASGGVFVVNGGTFNLNNGILTNNRSAGNGGGVHVAWDGTFNMRGGMISDNSSAVGGGGVFNAGTFRMSDGIILGSNVEADGNAAPSNGALANNASANVGTFNAAGVFANAGVLRSTALTVHVQNGVLQGMTGTLAAQVEWLRSFAQSGSEYVLRITGDETIAPQQVLTGTNLTIVLDGGTAMRTISLSGIGSLLTVGSGVTLILGNNVTLEGLRFDGNGSAWNEAPLVAVNGGTLVMNAGSRVIGNANRNTTGGGVLVNAGVFNMNGGEISGNASTAMNGGGGVRILSNGTFNMRGGRIADNSSIGNGGGVSNEGTLNISDGTILGSAVAGGNTAPNNGALFTASVARFGTFVNDVFVASGALRSTCLTVNVGNGVLQGRSGPLAAELAWLRSFAQDGGEYAVNVTGNVNLAPQDFTGIALLNDGVTFTVSGGGTIALSETGSLFTVGSRVTLALADITLRGRAGNNAPVVYIAGGTVTMREDSVITGNSSSVLGGGVLVANDGVFNGTLVMDGGTISDNVSGGVGGGVAVLAGNTFTMNSGTISGNSSTNAPGGGVHVFPATWPSPLGGTFNMRGGTIYGNNTNGNGGGVSLGGNGARFQISDGVIYGNNAAVEANRNVAARGAALFNNGGTAQCGTFNAAEQFDRVGDLATIESTVHVVAGALRPVENEFAISFDDFMDMAQGIDFASDPIRLLEGGIITVSNLPAWTWMGGGLQSIRWFFEGSEIVSARDNYSLWLTTGIFGTRIGTHHLTLEIMYRGRLYSRIITFRVVLN